MLSQDETDAIRSRVSMWPVGDLTTLLILMLTRIKELENWRLSVIEADRK